MEEKNKKSPETAKAGITVKFMAHVEKLGRPAALFISLLPALIAGALCLRAAGFAAWIFSGGSSAAAGVVLPALGLDLLALARYMPVLFVLSLPFLRGDAVSRPRALAALWSLPLLLEAALAMYFLKSGVPLGSDLFGYTSAELLVTVKGGGAPSLPMLAGLAAALAALWTLLPRLQKRGAALPPRAAAGIMAFCLVMLIAMPGQPRLGPDKGYASAVALNKTAFFAGETAAYFTPGWLKHMSTRRVSGAVFYKFRYLDPAYPFLHEEQTPDALGPYFNRTASGAAPNLVFIIVEGLGRSFSGPGAVLGSFTPGLDALAGKSLYWENFLATQGRTFGVLSSLLGSLPFGENGFAELGEAMPAHITLLSALKAQGYRLKAYAGSNADFDNDRTFYTRNGVDSIVDEAAFGPGYRKSNSWGYADRELFARVLAGEAGGGGPFVTVIKTETTHTPYTFIGQEAYAGRFEARLDQLGIPAGKKAAYRAYKEMYASVLYTDTELSSFIESYRKLPAYANTIFVITGDHRLPEIPQSTKIDRYHVPLLIFSPLLKAPARMKSVSSHLDVAPSLLAFLAHNYGLKTPRAVTWLGSGLDMETSFRNTHFVPIKQTKTNLADFVSGSWYLNGDTLYKLGDSLDIAASYDAATLGRLRGQLASFSAGNSRMVSRGLMPAGNAALIGPYEENGRAMPPAPEEDAGAAGLGVKEVRSPESAAPGKLEIEVVFSNPGEKASPAFQPLVVLMTDGAAELSETYGALEQLPAGGEVPVRMEIKSADVKPGRYFMAVIPSDPNNGKAVGTGRYRIPVLLK